MKPILNDPKIAPVEAVLQNAMGDNFVNYTSLLEIVSKHGLTPEWHYYNDGKSWLCKMMYKKNNAFWFSVWADCFKTSFYFTEKDVEKIASLPISETTKSEFLMQKPAGKLIPMIISIKDSEPLNDIDVIIEYKLSKKMNTDYKVSGLIYDANIYDEMNTFLSDLQFYKKWLPVNKDARILELCCGTGRLTLPIAKDGYNICGVDYTPSMLNQARLKANEAGLKINFIQADIRTLDLQEKFDLVFIPFNSIHHLYRNEDLFKALECVKKHLKEGGLFLLDCFNPNIQYIVESEKGQAVIAEYTTGDGRNVLIKQTMRYESATQINRIEWHYFINGEFHSTQNLDMRLFFPQELDSYLERAGFNIIHKFGSFEEEPFDDKSEKQIYILSLNHLGDNDK